MSEHIRITLQPLGAGIDVERGTPLQDVLFAYGIEFPCGGRGRCKRCRIRVVEGTLEPGEEERRILGAEDIAAGWRLACRSKAQAPVTLDVAQWETAILADESAFEFRPEEGLGIAVDLGTTTLVAQLLDLRTAHVLAVRTALNPQAVHGADIMSRVQFALTAGGKQKLEALIRAGIGELVAQLAPARPVRRITVAGNTVMHHLFCGIDIEPLAHVPFEPVRDGLETFAARDLGWEVPGNPEIAFLPCLGGFVGSDILAGVLATRIHECADLQGLIDLGTNGEILFGTRERMVCASAAAGPAFEAGRIGMGMRADTGAIAEVRAEQGAVRCHVLGGGSARGICGSGLVDAVAAGLDLGIVSAPGRLQNGVKEWPLCPPVTLSQRDIRELQLAKGAVAAGIRIVLRRLGAEPGDVKRLYLAGAFGNYVNRASAQRIGLIGFGEDVVEPAGNTSLLGAKLALFDGQDFESIRRRTEHISLASDAEFQDIFVDEMSFPA